MSQPKSSQSNQLNPAASEVLQEALDFVQLWSRPSYNIAVLKCQIDVAPLTSSLFHIPHMPSNRTPATLVQ